ncbi:hypothetical protein [Humidisolicoccus flavus]|uniref:hypothetical protein n=1 Tax=Humidisolicoccus flavus TaxID=3111414 RepID=UPI0032511B2C
MTAEHPENESAPLPALNPEDERVQGWDEDDDDEPRREPGPPSFLTYLALGMASGAIILAAFLRNTVSGNSELALAALEGDSGALLLSVLGFGGVVVLAIGALIVSIDPMIKNRGRGLAILALVLAFTSPLIGLVIETAVSAIFFS